MKKIQYDLKNINDEILDIAPILNLNEILILSKTGTLYSFDLKKQIVIRSFKTNLPILHNGKDHYYHKPCYELHVSSNGLFSAIVVNYGQFGQIICNQTGKILLSLNAQNYHEDTVPFSFVFTQFENEDIVIYRSDWNKLETYNLTKKISTTERMIMPYEDQRPDHYLDYFHGALYVSPNGQYILDDGWVWHPVSIPRVWSLKNWLTKNSFESEDGESIKKHFRDNWDYPACWLNDNFFAFWHIELWDEEEFDVVPTPNNGLGIQIFSLYDNENISWEMPEQTQKIFNLYTDQDLLIVVGNENISYYSISDRKLINHISNALPQKHHVYRSSLFSFKNKTIYEFKYLKLGT